MDFKIVEANDLPLGEKVFLKKDIFGWRVVEPPTKWYHWLIGSKRNFFILLFLLLLFALFYLGIKELTSGCKEIINNPCAYCKSVRNIDYNFTNFNFDKGDDLRDERET